MAKELKWSKQVEQIVHKANKVLALLKCKNVLKMYFSIIPTLSKSKEKIVEYMKQVRVNWASGAPLLLSAQYDLS